jgi:hypothetical protein
MIAGGVMAATAILVAAGAQRPSTSSAPSVPAGEWRFVAHDEHIQPLQRPAQKPNHAVELEIHQIPIEPRLAMRAIDLELGVLDLVIVVVSLTSLNRVGHHRHNANPTMAIAAGKPLTTHCPSQSIVKGDLDACDLRRHFGAAGPSGWRASYLISSP